MPNTNFSQGWMDLHSKGIRFQRNFGAYCGITVCSPVTLDWNWKYRTTKNPGSQSSFWQHGCILNFKGDLHSQKAGRNNAARLHESSYRAVIPVDLLEVGGFFWFIDSRHRRRYCNQVLVLSFPFGIFWQISKTASLSDQHMDVWQRSCALKGVLGIITFCFFDLYLSHSVLYPKTNFRVSISVA